MKMKPITSRHYVIKEEQNEIDDHLLNIIGNSFKFDHIKGLGEWIKNSVDAYRWDITPDENQHIVLRFADGQNESAVFECIDFVGMTQNKIIKALKRWGDPEAAKFGKKDLKVYGGHGNGGKFYMREMFEESYFVTYRDGKLNIFGFSKNKRYGFARGYENLSVSPSEALKIAKLENLILPVDIKKNIISGKTGFTVIRGIRPNNMKNMVRVRWICSRLKNHSQVRRLLGHIPVTVIYNEQVVFNPLKPEPLPPLPGFENIEPAIAPRRLNIKDSDGDLINVEIASKKYPSGVLKLYTSNVAMDAGNKYGELNRIDIIGALGVVASYRIQELSSAGFLPQLVFIYGECECQSLEDPEADCVQNDRTKLVENDLTKALLEWIGEQVKNLSESISEKERKEQERSQRQLSSLYNNFLDNWKNKFMSRVFSKILVGPGEGLGGGNGIGGSLGTIGSGTGNSGKSGGGQGDKSGGGDTEKKGSKFPQVLLSAHDPDPMSPTGETLILDPRHGAIWQRPQDVDEGIYWINTSSPLATSILDKYGVNHPRWRDYLLQRYFDIFVQEALGKLEKRDPDSFTFSAVSQMIRDVNRDAQEAASKDLLSFLFEDNFDPDRI